MGKKGLRITTVVVILSAIALRAAFFTISVTHLPTSSDEALSILQAKRIATGHTPLLVKGNTYQFPVSAYLSVPFVKILPRNAFGARILPLLLGIATTLVLTLIMLRLAPLRQSWPGLMLILFPSAYLLMVQTAYMVPQHNSFLLLGALSIWSALIHRSRRSTPFRFAALTGLLAGLAFSNHLVALPLIIMITLFIILDEQGKFAVKALPAYAAGLSLGTAPYWLARMLFPGAYGTVTGIDTIPKTISKLWPYTITYTLPRALGFNPCYFPDSRETLEVLPGFEALWGILFGIGLVAAVGFQGFHFVRQAIRNRWPTITTSDLFVGISVFTLLLFVLNKRSTVESFRYLLPLVLFYPFLLCHCPGRDSPRFFRLISNSFILLVVGINILMTLNLAIAWQEPDFARKKANIADIQPALARLQELGITHACASYWASYRITYETDGAITCSQPINERFPGWQVPYKAEVDQSTNVAYVLTEGIRFLKPHIFDRHLKTMGITSQRETFNDFVVHYDFKQTEAAAARVPISTERIILSSSHNPAEVSLANDGDTTTRWVSGKPAQEPGMWIQANLPEPRLLSAIRITHDRYFDDHPPLIDIRVLTEAGWQTVIPGLPKSLDKFEFKNGHPVYGGIGRQTISLPSQPIHALQLADAKPRPGSSWSICELELFEQPATHPLSVPTRLTDPVME